MNLLSYELTKLVDDYYKCENNKIKEQIRGDIKFLTDAYLLSEEKQQTQQKSIQA